MVTARVGVIGHPISQSLSPRLHGRWIEKYGLDARYDPIDGQDEATFVSLVRSFDEKGFVGANVTIPFKHLAYETVDELTDSARKIGAVNLIVLREGKLVGDNTDSPGFAAGLKSMGLQAIPKRARLLGAGGAAPAIIVALQSCGVDTIEILNRTRSKAELLSERFECETRDWEARNKDLGAVDLLINCTSLGMEGQPPLGVDPAGLPGHAGVIDIVTKPRETELLAAARAMGQMAMNGLPMLVHQAIPSFEAWFGIRPDTPEEDIAFLETAAS